MAIPSITPGTSALFGGIFVLIGIVFFITRTEIHKLRDKSIIDEIRMDIV